MPPRCTMPCPDSDTLKVKDILIVHPNCNSNVSRWVITCETGTIAAMCARCYRARIADLTPAILVGHTCVLGALFTPAVLERVKAEKEQLTRTTSRLKTAAEHLHRLCSHADSVCDALHDDPSIASTVCRLFGKRNRELRKKVKRCEKKILLKRAIIASLCAATELCGVQQPCCLPPHPLFAHIHRSINSSKSVEEDLAALLRDTIRSKNHRMAGLLAAKLLLLNHDPQDLPGKHLEVQSHMILDMINAAREETP